MPCDSIRTYSVDFKNVNKDVLKKAVERLGFQMHEAGKTTFVYTPSGTILLDGETALGTESVATEINTLRQEYVKEGMKWAGQKAGWAVSETGKNKLHFSRGM